jgi:aspartyl-tRNA synthetase
LFVLKVTDTGVAGPLAPKITPAEARAIAALTGAQTGDAVLVAGGGRRTTLAALGALRKEIGRVARLYDEGAWSLLWVVDAPMFEQASHAEDAGDLAVGDGEWTPVHHAFTAPRTEWARTFASEPSAAISDSYDLICNGSEIGGGSMRIHDRDTQLAALNVVGIPSNVAEAKFGFLLDALSLGAPPHGGIALGLDRIMALLTARDTIRDVIAFPKTGGGADPLTGAPALVSDRQLAEVHISRPSDPSRAVG